MKDSELRLTYPVYMKFFPPGILYPSEKENDNGEENRYSKTNALENLVSGHCCKRKHVKSSYMSLIHWQVLYEYFLKEILKYTSTFKAHSIYKYIQRYLLYKSIKKR